MNNNNSMTQKQHETAGMAARAETPKTEAQLGIAI
jgi:hypothetical protein